MFFYGEKKKEGIHFTINDWTIDLLDILHELFY